MLYHTTDSLPEIPNLKKYDKHVSFATKVRVVLIPTRNEFTYLFPHLFYRYYKHL